MPQGFKKFFIGDVSSPTVLQIHPTFEYSEQVETRRENYESETGRVRQAKLEGGKFRFSVPFSLTNSSDANQIRGYWRNADTVCFTTVFSNSLAEYVYCRIINTDDPFDSYTENRFVNFDGVLTLISVNDQNTDRGIQKSVGIYGLAPFILDDTVQGILDNTTYLLG